MISNYIMGVKEVIEYTEGRAKHCPCVSSLGHHDSRVVGLECEEERTEESERNQTGESKTTTRENRMIPDISRRNLMKAVGLVGLASAANVAATEPAQAVDRRGPVRNNRFSVNLELDGTEINGWSKVKLPETRVLNNEYRTGDEPSQNRQLWGASEYDPLVLERGVEPEGEMPITGNSMAGTKLYDWIEKIRLGLVDANRKDITVTILNEQGEAVVGYLFHHAFPVKYTPPTLDAMDNDIARESLTLVYHWYERADP